MLRYAVLAALVAVGCLGAETVECPGGGLCPAGTACRLDRAMQVCVPEACGNGVLEPGEDCDDGNSTGGDGCQATCRLTIRPAERAGAAMAYDSLHDQLVVFGGQHLDVFDDTWVWDGDDWTEHTQGPPAPAARWGAAITYDSTADVVLMFGGFDAGRNPLGDFWVWNGDRWSPRGPPQPFPSPRAGASMAHDRIRDVTVLYGGMASTGRTDETWEWHAQTIEWRQLQPSAAPSPREGAAMTFDESRGEVMLVGGIDDNNTWIWNGTRWATIGGLDTPSEYRGAGLVYDRVRRRSVLFGGLRDGLMFGGTWELTSASGWVQRNVATVPPLRDSFGMAYDDTNDVIMVFGGNGPGSLEGATRYNDLWSWNGTSWTEYQ